MTTKEKLQKQIDELQAKLDALQDDKPKSTGRWKPDLGEEYGFVDFCYATACNTAWDNYDVDETRYKIGNIYRTKEEAQAALDKQLATVRVLDRIVELNAEQGWVCDWGNHNQIKYIFRFDHDDRTFYFDSTYMCQAHRTSCYCSKQTLETVIKEMESDCLLMLGVETQDV